MNAKCCCGQFRPKVDPIVGQFDVRASLRFLGGIEAKGTGGWARFVGGGGGMLTRNCKFAPPRYFCNDGGVDHC